ncbi:MAG: ribonuclease PH [Chloroflexi bacterium]|nr:ribonuclease PH [Chloroflexota bacterium]
MTRNDGRALNALRPVSITLGAQAYAEGSVIVETGQTRVLCAVSVEDGVPRFLRGTGQGWVTAEYSMLPRSTLTRTPRSSATGGRTREIQRLIGRSLRAIVDMDKLGARTLTVDCDVLQADGGTRTAAITGAYVALYQAVLGMLKRDDISEMPIKNAIAATSVGIVGDQVMLDLCYEEDSRAEVDFNLVMTDEGEFVEVQGTAEGKPFSRESLNSILTMAEKGIEQLFQAQKEVIDSL